MADRDPGPRGAAVDPLLSRSDLLGGHGRRAQSLLLQIEGSAIPPADGRQSGAAVAADQNRDGEADYLRSFVARRRSPHKPTLGDIERRAPAWAALLPDDPTVRAAVAKLLADKYHVEPGTTPGIRAALGLDSPAVLEAFLRLFGRPVDGLF